MFEDIKEGIIEGDFSPMAIPEFFETTSSILFRECKNCGSDAILKVARTAEKGAKAVRDMTYSYYEYEDIKEKSLMETQNILNRLWEISNATLAYVEKFSYNSFFARKSFHKVLFC